jgi:RHS repeat-associated protein
MARWPCLSIRCPGQTDTPTGDNGDQHDFALMDRDLEDNTEHAQFRQYSTNLGRWQSPDLYAGSYDFTNPQSFNRYTYALNNPSSLVDPSGLTTTCVLQNGAFSCIDDGGINNTDCNSDYTACATASDCVACGTEGCITASNPGSSTSLDPLPYYPSGGGGGGSTGASSALSKNNSYWAWCNREPLTSWGMLAGRSALVRLNA